LQLASLKIDLKVVEGALHSAQPAAVALTLQTPLIYANPPPPSTTSAAGIKLLPVLTSTRVDKYSIAAALIAAQLQ